MKEPHKQWLLQIMAKLSVNEHITDTLWMPFGNTTIVEALAIIVSESGATEQQIADACEGKLPVPGEG